MGDSELTYDDVIDRSEPVKQRDLERFDIRVEKEEYRPRRSIIKRDRSQYKLRYFVIDHKEKDVLYVTEWDYPNDHRSGGRKSSAFGFRHGYKTALEKYDE